MPQHTKQERAKKKRVVRSSFKVGKVSRAVAKKAVRDVKKKKS